MGDVATVTRDLARVVADDSGLPRFARRQAAELAGLAHSQPERVLDQLEDLRRQVVPDLPLEPAECDYARCVSVVTFWRHHLRPEVQTAFIRAEDYRRWLDAARDPAGVARAHLNEEVLVPAAHSWLIPARRIDGLSGRQMKARLKLGDHPPYIVMVLPLERLRASGVEVREPRGVDAIPGRFRDWRAGDVPDERIDQDIPVAALGRLEWRP